MSKRVSELYGMDMYTQKGQYVGKVADVILNIEKGEVMRLSLQAFKGGTIPGDEVKKIIQSESVGYDEVVEVGDIIIVQKGPGSTQRK